ncbi:MAG: nuclear transport factor 2 family protein [Bauldia litoralis]
MTEQANVALMRDAYAKWGQDTALGEKHWLQIISDDIAFWSIAEGAPGMEFSRDCACKDDMARYFRELAEDWELGHFTMREFVTQGDTVVSIGDCSWRHRRTGKTCHTPKIDIARIRDGKIVSYREFYDTAKALSAATS